MIEKSRTISISGKAVVKAPSDITIVRAKVSGIAKTFDKAMGELAKITKDLKDAVEGAGIERTALKTTDLSVDRHFKKVRNGTDKNGCALYKTVSDGFEYKQNVFFEFPNDNAKLSKAVTNIVKCDIEPKIVFSYRSSKFEEAKNDALAKAVENARREAEIIVSAAGAKLGKLLDVTKDTYYRERYYEDNEVYCDADMCCNNSMPLEIDLEPEDEDVSQSVRLTWEIVG